MRSPIAKFLSEQELARFPQRAGSTVLFGPASQACRARARRAPAPPRPGARPDRRDARRVPLGDRLPALRVGRGGASAGLRRTIRSRAWSRGTRSCIESDPGSVVARPTTWSGTAGSSARARSGSTARRSRSASFASSESPTRRRTASSASCSRRCGWARLRTAASRSGSTASSRLLAGEPNIREVIAFPKAASGSDPMTGAPTTLPDEQLAELGIRVVPTERWP